MNDYEKIVAYLKREYNYMHARNQYPNRVILGIEIVKILDTYCNDYILKYRASNKDFWVMNLPVTVDYQDKWIMMVCAGNASDGEYILRT